MGLQADMRAAAVTLLTAYGQAAGVKLQVYPGRPATFAPPTAFVDRIHEHLTSAGIELRQRSPVVEVIVVHGLFDSQDAAVQKDAFIDGFLDYVATQYHAAGANTLIEGVDTEDIPDWVPGWLPPEKQRTYYASQISLEGYAEN
jgi:hypothetical protein